MAGFARRLVSGCALGLLVISVAPLAVLADDAAATTPAGATADNDPLEGLNRFTSSFNRALRDTVIDPLVDGYQYVTPLEVQRGVVNVFSNLSEPITAVSSLLQGDVDNASTSTKRFLINTTLGLGGTSDHATGMGLEQRREDLGQAFGANGVAPGPHIVLPILGPSNLRDATGDILTGFASPLPLAVHAADGGVRYSDHQDDVHAITAGSMDPYVTEREAYEQHRGYLVTNGSDAERNFPNFALEPSQDVANTTTK